tara:strand:- start:14 stop:943 length:930 start_codon:yes stop_codon:yes gene_type:complete
MEEFLKILVTGGAGFIGSHITDRLLSEGHEVVVVDNFSTGHVANVSDKATLVELDICNQGIVEIFEDLVPDVVIHCAAQASVYSSVNNPQLDARINILGGINVCKASNKVGCKQFVYITTGGALYGDPEYLPCDEDHPIRPISGYGLSKWTLENYLNLLLPDSIHLDVLRLANVYGPRQDPIGEAGVIAKFIHSMLRGKPVTIFGDGDQTRDFIYVSDVARICSMLLEKPDPVVINVGTGVPTSVNRLFQIVSSAIGYKERPRYESLRDGEVRHIYLDSSRAKKGFDWVAETSLDQGLIQTINSMRQLI